MPQDRQPVGTWDQSGKARLPIGVRAGVNAPGEARAAAAAERCLVNRLVPIAAALSVLVAPAAFAQHQHELGYVARLNGAGATPPNNSTAAGNVQLLIDFALFNMRVRVDFHELQGNSATAAIHGPSIIPLFGSANPITPPLPLFPTGATAGSYEHTLDLSQAASYAPQFLAASGGTESLASNRLFATLSAGKAYFSLTSAAYPGGEIAGFLLPTPKADFDFDGVVARSDLVVWCDAYGSEHFGDADGDGLTTGSDFLAWQQQVGAVASLDGGHHGVVAVPESGAARTAGIAALLAAAARRRQQAAAGQRRGASLRLPTPRGGCQFLREKWLQPGIGSGMIRTLESHHRNRVDHRFVSVVAVGVCARRSNLDEPTPACGGKECIMTTRFVGLLAAISLALAAASSHAAVTTYSFTFNGASENPVNSSPATGTGTAAYDSVLHTLTLQASVTGLLAPTTQAHFHGVTTTSGLPDNNPPGETLSQAAAAVANASIAVGNPSLLNFPLNVTTVSYNQVIDLTLTSTYNNAFLSGNGGTTAGAEAAFVAALASGRTYWNIHTASPNGFPGGEVRAFPVLIPEPAALGLLALAAVALAARRRR